jgi:hypothetical protein
MLEFVNRGKGAKVMSKADITITLGKEDTINFSFRNDAIFKITNANNSHNNRFEYAIDGNRLYFRGTASNRGFSCYNQGKGSKNYYCRINKQYQTNELIDFVLQYEGDHELLFDTMTNLYYIECGIKFHNKDY